MRSGRGNDQRVILPTLDKSLGVGNGLARCFIVGDRKLYDRLAKHSTHAGLFCFVGDGILKVVHVAIGRCSTPDHLSQTQPRTGPHELLIDILSLCRKDVFGQPVVEVEIVRDAAKQRHGDVGVSIDEAGYDDLAGSVDGSFGTNAGRSFSLSDKLDLSAGYSNSSIFDHPPVLIHGNDRSADDKKVDVLCLNRR